MDSRDSRDREQQQHEELSYDADFLEEEIDKCRLSGNWIGCMKGVKRYAHVFDVGMACVTKQHLELKTVLAYYWVCMAESLLENNLDYLNAIDCIKRSQHSDKGYVDSNICLCRILLDVCAPLIQEIKLCGELWPKSTNIDSHRSFEEQTATLNPSQLKPAGNFAECFGKISVDDQQHIFKSFASSEYTYRNVLLSVLNILSYELVNSILINIVSYIKTEVKQNQQKSSSSNPYDSSVYTKLLRYSILETSRQLLNSVIISNGVLMEYFEGRRSIYRLWLLLDAVLTRSVINEILGSYRDARSDCTILMNCAYGNNVSIRRPLHKLVPVLRNIIITATCRIPLIEIALGLYEDAAVSFKRCIVSEENKNSYLAAFVNQQQSADIANQRSSSEDNFISFSSAAVSIRRFLPLSLIIGILYESSILILMRAYIYHADIETLRPDLPDYTYNIENTRKFIINSLEEAIELLFSAKDLLSADLESIFDNEIQTKSGGSGGVGRGGGKEAAKKSPRRPSSGRRRSMSADSVTSSATITTNTFSDMRLHNENRFNNPAADSSDPMRESAKKNKRVQSMRNIEYLSISTIYSLPMSQFEPRHFSKIASPKCIAILLASILEFKCNVMNWNDKRGDAIPASFMRMNSFASDSSPMSGKSDRFKSVKGRKAKYSKSNRMNDVLEAKFFVMYSQVAEVLEWGLSEEIRSDIDLLVFASRAYSRIARFDKSLALLDQAFNAAIYNSQTNVGSSLSNLDVSKFVASQCSLTLPKSKFGGLKASGGSSYASSSDYNRSMADKKSTRNVDGSASTSSDGSHSSSGSDSDVDADADAEVGNNKDRETNDDIDNSTDGALSRRRRKLDTRGEKATVAPLVDNAYSLSNIVYNLLSPIRRLAGSSSSAAVSEPLETGGISPISSPKIGSKAGLSSDVFASPVPSTSIQGEPGVINNNLSINCNDSNPHINLRVNIASSPINRNSGGSDISNTSAYRSPRVNASKTSLTNNALTRNRIKDISSVVGHSQLANLSLILCWLGQTTQPSLDPAAAAVLYSESIIQITGDVEKAVSVIEMFLLQMEPDNNNNNNNINNNSNNSHNINNNNNNSASKFLEGMSCVDLTESSIIEADSFFSCFKGKVWKNEYNSSSSSSNKNNESGESEFKFNLTDKVKIWEQEAAFLQSHHFGDLVSICSLLCQRYHQSLLGWRHNGLKVSPHASSSIISLLFAMGKCHMTIAASNEPGFTGIRSIKHLIISNRYFSLIKMLIEASNNSNIINKAGSSGHVSKFIGNYQTLEKNRMYSSIVSIGTSLKMRYIMERSQCFLLNNSIFGSDSQSFVSNPVPVSHIANLLRCITDSNVDLYRAFVLAKLGLFKDSMEILDNKIIPMMSNDVFYTSYQFEDNFSELNLFNDTWRMIFSQVLHLKVLLASINCQQVELIDTCIGICKYIIYITYRKVKDPVIHFSGIKESASKAKLDSIFSRHLAACFEAHSVRSSNVLVTIMSLDAARCYIIGDDSDSIIGSLGVLRGGEGGRIEGCDDRFGFIVDMTEMLSAICRTFHNRRIGEYDSLMASSISARNVNSDDDNDGNDDGDSNHNDNDNDIDDDSGSVQSEESSISGFGEDVHRDYRVALTKRFMLPTNRENVIKLLIQASSSMTSILTYFRLKNERDKSIRQEEVEIDGKRDEKDKSCEQIEKDKRDKLSADTALLALLTAWKYLYFCNELPESMNSIVDILHLANFNYSMSVDTYAVEISEARQLWDRFLLENESLDSFTLNSASERAEKAANSFVPEDSPNILNLSEHEVAVLLPYLPTVGGLKLPLMSGSMTQDNFSKELIADILLSVLYFLEETAEVNKSSSLGECGEGGDRKKSRDIGTYGGDGTRMLALSKKLVQSINAQSPGHTETILFSLESKLSEILKESSSGAKYISTEIPSNLVEKESSYHRSSVTTGALSIIDALLPILNCNPEKWPEAWYLLGRTIELCLGQRDLSQQCYDVFEKLKLGFPIRNFDVIFIEEIGSP